MENKASQATARKVLLIVYLVLAGLAQVIYIGLTIKLRTLQGAPSFDPSILMFLMFSVLFDLVSWVIFFITVLLYHYRARNLCFLLIPFFGGIVFASFALAGNKTEPKTLRFHGKAWDILAVLGLIGLDQLVQIFTLTATNQKMPLWAIILNTLSLLGAIVYFIYWGRKRAKVEWKLRNFWKQKWAILIGIVAFWVYNFVYFWVMNALHIIVPTGGNQAELNQLQNNIPFPLFWFMLAIFAPILEETIFRAGFFELISPKHPTVAWIVSSFFFAFVHMLNNLWIWQLWLVYLPMGLILGGIYYKTRKIEASASVHFLWNGFISFLPMPF